MYGRVVSIRVVAAPGELSVCARVEMVRLAGVVCLVKDAESTGRNCTHLVIGVGDDALVGR